MGDNKIKKIISIILVLVLLFTNFDITLFADIEKYKISTEKGGYKIVNYSVEEEYRELIKKIVSTSSDKMAEIYPKTFGHLKESGLTLGFHGLDDDSGNSDVLALVFTSVTRLHNPEQIQLSLQLKINIREFRVKNQPIEEKNKKRLISVITHEMMHAMMMEALTAGMTGHHVNADAGERLPNWFIEGTAVVSGGGTAHVDSMLSYQGGKHIKDPTLTEEDVKKAIKKASLELGREAISKTQHINASYGTGYLACMYLGNIIGNDGNIQNDDEPDLEKIRKGLDTLMSEIAKGYSLDQVIKKLTPYEGLKDFEENSLDALSHYSFKLIPKIKGGMGSALTALNSEDVFEYDKLNLSTNPTIVLNDNYTRMTNKYPVNHIVIKGGAAYNTGYDIYGNFPEDAAKEPIIKVDTAVVEGIKIDKKNDKIIGFTDGVYLIDGEKISPEVDGSLDITSYLGKTISIVKQGHNYLKKSKAFELSVPTKEELDKKNTEQNSESKEDEKAKEESDTQVDDANSNQSLTSPASTKTSTKRRRRSSSLNSSGNSSDSKEASNTYTESEEKVNTPLDSNVELNTDIETKKEAKQEEKKQQNKKTQKKSDSKEKKKIVSVKNEKVYKDSFKDIDKKNWYYDAVKFVYEKGIMKGEKQASFNPKGNVTRGQLVTMLHRLSGNKENKFNNAFKDVEQGKWYTDAVNWASNNEIVYGVSKNEFAPNKNVSREELVTILYRYTQKYITVDVMNRDSLSKFNDLDKVSSFAKNPMEWAVSEGLVSGVSDTSIAPKNGANRAEIATIFMRYIKKYD